MSRTLNVNQLHQIKVGGAALSKQLTEAAISLSLSSSTSKVTELKGTFQDDNAQTLFVGERLREGTTIGYGSWSCKVFKVSVGANAAGPTLTVTARSAGVHAMMKQTGGKTWGTQQVSNWVESIARSHGMGHIVQPGLGSTSIVREKPDGEGESESTWDVLTSLAKEVGCWVYEYGNTLVFARPTWLLLRPGRNTWFFQLSSWRNVQDTLASSPAYEREAGAETPEKLTVELASLDADGPRPGESVVLAGGAAGKRRGSWIITDVDYSFSRVSPVKLTCVRAVDPEKQPPKPPPNKTKTTGKKTSSGARSGVRAQSATVASASNPAVNHLNAFIRRYNGARLDFDGSYGAQCVDLVKAWNQQVVGGPVIRGNGKDWYRNTLASGAYTRVSRGRAGDIITWDGSWGGGYGHVGIVVQDGGGPNLRVFDQFNGRTSLRTASRRGIIGITRPKKWA